MPHFILQVLDQAVVDCLDRHGIVDPSASEFTVYEVVGLLIRDKIIEELCRPEERDFDWVPVIEGRAECPPPYSLLIKVLDAMTPRRMEETRQRLFAIADQRQADRKLFERNAARNDAP
jgi:hypothetical protein